MNNLPLNGRRENWKYEATGWRTYSPHLTLRGCSSITSAYVGTFWTPTSNLVSKKNSIWKFNFPSLPPPPFYWCHTWQLKIYMIWRNPNELYFFFKPKILIWHWHWHELNWTLTCLLDQHVSTDPSTTNQYLASPYPIGWRTILFLIQFELWTSGDFFIFFF